MSESELGPKEHELKRTLSSGYLRGLWGLSNTEEVIKKLELQGIPYKKKNDGGIEVLSEHIPVGGKFDDEK